MPKTPSTTAKNNHLEFSQQLNNVDSNNPSDPEIQDKLSLSDGHDLNRRSRNSEKTTAWYEESAAQGNADSQFRLGYFYEWGLGGYSKNLTQAAEWYKKAAKQRHAEAQCRLGYFYALGLGGLSKNLLQAAKWYGKSAVQGNADAQCCMARLLEGAIGREFDDGPSIEGAAVCESVATELYKKSAAQGDAYAQFKLGYYYEEGLGGLSKDLVQAAEWYKKSVEQGEAKAQNNLGCLYEKGFDGHPANLVEAAEWYKKAAEQGYAYAQYNLGRLYEKGFDGHPANLAETVIWYTKAAEQGDAETQYWLGYFYELGLGGLSKNSTEAKKWYEKAAAQGYFYAQYNLGYFYEKGLDGNPANLVEAAEWYEKAAAQGERLAEDRLIFCRTSAPILPTGTENNAVQIAESEQNNPSVTESPKKLTKKEKFYKKAREYGGAIKKGVTSLLTRNTHTYAPVPFAEQARQSEDSLEMVQKEVPFSFPIMNSSLSAADLLLISLLPQQESPTADFPERLKTPQRPSDFVNESLPPTTVLKTVGSNVNNPDNDTLLALSKLPSPPKNEPKVNSTAPLPSHRNNLAITQGVIQ